MTHPGPWVKTFATSVILDRELLADDPVVIRLSTRRFVQEAVFDKLKMALERAVAVPVDDVTLRVSDIHADFFVRNQVAVIAEARALVLRHPNPFPRLRLFGWLPA